MIKRYVCFVLLLASSAQAAEWGRLFYSQGERERGVVTEQTTLAPPVSVEKRFDGELQTPRRKVRWVNGQIAEPRAGVKPGTVWQEPQ
jgi:hypothetical protein